MITWLGKKKNWSNWILCNCEICLLLKKTLGESKTMEINKFKKKWKNEDINSCVYALIQLSGHPPKTVFHNILVNGWYFLL